MESIQVGYRNIGKALGIEYHHKFLLYTNNQGQQFTISGWTDPNNITKDLPYGNIRVLTNLPFNANNPDNRNYSPDNMRQKQYLEPIIQGADLSKTWQQMIINAKNMDNIYPYDPLKQNSNTLADAVLNSINLKQPVKDDFELFNHWSPASGNKLDKNIKPKEIKGASDLISQNNLNPQYIENTIPKLSFEEAHKQALQIAMNNTNSQNQARII